MSAEQSTCQIERAMHVEFGRLNSGDSTLYVAYHLKTLCAQCSIQEEDAQTQPDD